jgi:dipeptidyl aminopeptidase/acylaminoacyl peptidase
MSGLEIKDLFSRPGAPAYPFKDDKGQLCWLEPLTEEGGRLALKQKTALAERIITPAGFQFRSRVHEYGGKCFCIAGDRVYFNNFEDGLIYRQNLHQDVLPIAVSSPTTSPSSYADLHYSKALNAIVAVQEIQCEAPEENRNQLVAFSLAENPPIAPRVLTRGADFYAAPCVSNSGNQISWLQWDHPDMPWDASCLVRAGISNDGGVISLGETQQVAGGEATSVCQPGFLRNGDLVFAMDRATTDQATGSESVQNYWNLYRSDEEATKALTRDDTEYGEAHWVFGQHRWVQTSESTLLAIATRDEADHLVEIDLNSGAQRQIGAGYARLSQLSVSHGVAFCVADYADKPAEIIEIKFDAKVNNPDVNILKAQTPWLAVSEVSQPELVCYPTRDSEQAYANYYPAKVSALIQNPALLVLVHGGPTSRSDTALSPLVQYFAQNGFAVLGVNHRGSTGHGRAYRQALLGQWGEIDANDIADAINFIVADRRLDPGRVFIRGGSAGGYAVLRALTRFPELFCGGACYYGIGNLITLSEITHKFEGRYTDQLIGETYSPESAVLPESRFRSRSPIFDIDRIKSPLILFQGLDDKVVPPEVSREMVRTLEKNGVAYEYIEYPGEGHGFRKAETKIDALSQEVDFYKDILGSK